MESESSESNDTILPCHEHPTYLIDASIYIFRAWYTWPRGQVDKNGQSIHAVLGFIDFVQQFLTCQNVEFAHIAFAFDESQTDSLRRAIYPEYKQNRQRLDDNLRYQFQLCRRFIRLLGIVEASSPRYEADDIIATWTRQQVALQRHVYILSGDKDLAQLVSDQVTWWEYVRQQQFNVKQVTKKFGVPPNKIAAQLALAGDKADNIRGVPEIGMTTAAKLLRKFGSLEQLLASIEQISTMKAKMAMRWQIALAEHQEKVNVYYQLTRLYDTVPKLECELKRRPRDKDSLIAFCSDLQLDAMQRQCLLKVN